MSAGRDTMNSANGLSPGNTPKDLPHNRREEHVKLAGCLRQFDTAGASTVHKKLQTMREQSSNLELWADFDNTLTARNFGIYEALRNALPLAGQIESDTERRINLARERDGSLSIEENIVWTKHEIGRYSQYSVTTNDIIRAVEAVRLRTGARALFAFCDEAGINRHIISASIADAIELVGLRPTHIYSNKLHIKDGIVIGWDEENMLHAHNKHLYTKVVLTDATNHREGHWKVVLGDSRHDADMIPGDNVLRLRVHGRRGNTKEYLAESFARSRNGAQYDMVLRTESLMPVVRLLRWLTGGTGGGK
jgi:phosphoserine phosphatase